MDATSDALAAAGGKRHGRHLTAGELATIRGALRLWVETNGLDIPDRCFEEMGDNSGISDADIEQLLIDLALADDVVIAVLNPQALDPRRV